MPARETAHRGGPRTFTGSIRGIQIHRLGEKDVVEFSRLRLEALEREPRAFGESPEQHQTMSPEAIAQRLGSGSDHRNFVLGAFAEARLVGMAGFYQGQGAKARHKGHIWGVYVDQEWRGKGVARRLLEGVIQLANAKPEIEQLMLAVASGQDAAKKLYHSLGFEIYGREPHAIKLGQTYLDEDLMVLRLG
jgi:ribosomal protein S18 acetylase RimI-like enzyme